MTLTRADQLLNDAPPSQDSRSTLTLPTGDQAHRDGLFSPQISEEDKQLVMLFFGRLKFIYSGTWETVYPDERTLQLARREWADQITQFSFDELAKGLDKLKERMVNHDPDYAWPNIGKILGLVRDQKDAQLALCHKPFPESKKLTQAQKELGKTKIRALLKSFGRSV